MKIRTNQIFPLLLALMCASSASAATFTATTSGNWHLGATWGNAGNDVEGSGYPGAADTANIPTTRNVTNTATASAANLAVTTTGKCQNEGTLTVGTLLSGTGSLVQSAGATLNLTGSSPTITTLTATASGNTVNYSGAAQTVKAVTYNNLTLSGSGIKTLTSVATINGNLTLSGTATATSPALAIGGNLSIGDGTTFTVANTLTVTGTTTVGGGASGNLTISSATGTKTFTGLVTINAGGAWSNPANEDVIFRDGITSTPSFTGGSGVHTFDTSQTLTGTFSIPNVTVTGAAVVLTNTGTLTVSAALSGTGGLIQGTGATLNLGSSSGIATLTATATGNTVNYTGAAQTVKATTYHHLSLGGSGAKTLTGLSTINGNLALSGTPTATAAANLSIGGDLDVSGGTLDLSTFTANRATSGGTLTVENGATLRIGGTGTLPANYSTHVIGATSTVEYSGTAQTVSVENYGNLTLSGSGIKTMTGVTTIGGNLTISGTATMSGNGGFTVGGIFTYGSTAGTTTLTALTPISIGAFNQSGAGILVDNGNTITVTGTGATTWVRSAGTFTATGTTVFTGAAPQIGVANFNNLTFDGSAAAVTTGAVTVGGTLVIPSGTSLTVGAFAITVTGTTSVSGTLTHNSATGTKTYGGLVTINALGVWNNSGNSPVTFRGGITSTPTFTGGSGVHTFDTTASQTLTGTFSIPSLTVNSPTTLNNSGTLTVSTALAGTGGLTQGASATLNLGGTSAITTLTATASGNTVNYTGAAQTVHNNNYYDLTLSGSGAKTLGTGMTVISGNLTLSGTASATTVVGLVIGGDLTIGNGTTFTAAGFALTVTGTTTVGGGTSGNLTISSTTGTKIFTGLVTINAGATWNNAINSAVTFRGGITSTPTFTGGSGVHTFDTTASQTLTGTFSIPSVTVNSPTTLNNSGTLTVSTALAGTGALVNGATGTLNINFTGAMGIATLTATAVGNTVNYGFAGVQTVKNVNYHNLTLSGSGVKTMGAGITTLGGNLLLSGTPSATLLANLSVSGDLTVSGGTLDLSTFTADRAAAGGTLTVASGAALRIGGTGTLPDQYSTHSIGATSTIEYYGAAQSVATLNSSQNYGNLTISGTSIKTVTGTVGVGTLTVSSSTLQNDGTLTVTIALSGAGALVNGATGTLNIGGTSGITTLTATAVGNTVNYTGGVQTVKVTTYHHLTLSGSGVKTMTSVTTVNGDLTLSGTATAATAAALVIGGDLTIGNGTTFTAAGFALTVTGTTTVGGGTSGNLTISSTTGTKIFTGLVTINAGATWNNAINSAVTFRGGITSTPTFTGGSGVHTFDTTASQTLTGTFSIPSVTVNSPTTLNNSGTLTVSTALAGTGGLTQGTGATLNLGGDPTPASITTLTATASGNIVNYTSGNAQTVKPTAYHHLTLSGTSTVKTMTGVTTINGDLTLSDSATAGLGAVLTVSGDVTIGATAVLAAGANSLNLAGDWINNRGVAGFTYSGAQSVTLNGTGAQNIGGTATTTFNNLTVDKASGTATAGNSFTVALVFTIASGNTFDAADKTITLSGSGIPFVVNGTFTPSASTVNYNGASAVNVAGGINYNNLWIFTGFSTKTLTGGNISLTGDLNVGAGRFALGSFTADRTTSGGTLTIGGSGELDIGGTGTLPANFDTHLIASGSLVMYSGTAQTIAPLNSSQAYGTLVTLGTGTKTLNGSIEIVTAVNIGATAPIVVATGGLLKNSAPSFTTTGTLTLNSGATFQHNRNGGTIPTATWNANSTCEIVGVSSGTSFTSGLGQSFANFTWNCTNQTGTFGLGGSLTTVNGDFTIITNGSGTVQLVASTTSATLNIGGDLNQSGGSLILKAGTTGTMTVNVAGDLSLTGGTLNMSASTSSGTGIINVSGNVSISGSGLLTETSASTGNGSVFFPSGNHNFTNSGAIQNTIHFTVNNGATLEMGTNLITGSGNFTNSAGATLGIGRADGITTTPTASGNIQNTGTRLFNTAANYTYNGTAAQVVGNGLPATVNNLTIANAAGVTVNSTHTVSGTCTVNSGALLLGTGTINGLVIVNGTLAPGTSIGQFTVGNSPTLNGTLAMEIKQTDLTSDKLNLTSGVFTYGGTLALTVTEGTLVGGETFDLFDESDAGNSTGSFTITTAPALGAGLNWWQGSLVSNGILLLNRAPTASIASYDCTPSLSVGIQITGAGGLASDADGNTLTTDVPTGPSNGSATVLEIGSDTYIYYLNNGTTGPDSFDYRVNDGRGGITTRTISLTIAVPNAVSQNQLSIENLGGGQVRIRFLGIPGEDYALESTTDSGPFTWTTYTTATADSSGLVLYDNVTPTGSPTFYRTRWVP